ncbi:MAG: cytidylyltransferase domain-containing protein [Alphaproteobacteria bacterium]
MSFTLGIITARGGSKGIKNKNIMPINKKPLIHYTIEAAQRSQTLDDLILSTDSQKIIDCAQLAGLNETRLRPGHLATDQTKSNDVLYYEVNRYQEENNKIVDNIILLQPTSPLRETTDIDDAYKAYQDNNSKTLISCYNAESVHPQIMYKKNSDDLLTPFLESGKEIIRRQDTETLYIRNGAIYIMDVQYFLETKKTVCNSPALYEMPKSRSLNIDSPEDLALASFYLNEAEKNII